MLDMATICDDLEDREELDAMMMQDAMDDYEIARQSEVQENTGLCSTCGREESIPINAKNQVCKGCGNPTMQGANIIMGVEAEPVEDFEPVENVKVEEED